MQPFAYLLHQTTRRTKTTCKLKNEHELIQACIRGDRQAQRALYEQFKRLLFVVCLRYADNREEAEDMLQEGFVLIYRDLHQFSGQGPIGAWMRRVVVNTALQHIRRRKRDVLTAQLEDAHYAADNSPENSPITSLHTQDLVRMLQTLPIGYRTVLNLYVIEGFSHKEIAEMLNISVNTSKSQLSRAKELMRRTLERTLNT